MSLENLTPAELAKTRQELVRQLNKVEQEVDRRRREDRHIMRAEDWKWSDQTSAMLKKQQRDRRTASIISPELGFNIHNFHLTCMEIMPGAAEGAYHTHGEAIKFYLQGKGIELVGDERYEVKTGDAVFIPHSTWHGTQNPGPEPLRFLAVTHSGMGVPVTTWAKIQTRDDV